MINALKKRYVLLLFLFCLKSSSRDFHSIFFAVCLFTISSDGSAHRSPTALFPFYLFTFPSAPREELAPSREQFSLFWGCTGSFLVNKLERTVL